MRSFVAMEGEVKVEQHDEKKHVNMLKTMNGLSRQGKKSAVLETKHELKETDTSFNQACLYKRVCMFVKINFAIVLETKNIFVM